ncbi:COG3628 Phage baseplate assembly protein W [uncultured Caudovirales phage]|uniref:COG3628 Phage baseplate assembly protein W n=1 Tax=uncultured Caudovirales phage TaxID=2100421 RepID=A0A6J5RXQ6_9CAUD|nr:COG3628 Phage baseplate assembly protein W [uncultured Caudovirales phage]
MDNIRGISMFFATPAGIPGPVEGETSLIESFQQILGVTRFERVMRPSSGSGLLSLLFENMSALTRARIVEEAKRALRAGEKRAQIEEVRVASFDDTGIVLDVVYRRLGRRELATLELSVGGGS